MGRAKKLLCKMSLLIAAVPACGSKADGGHALEEWACRPQTEVAVAAEEQVEGRVSPAGMGSLLGGTFLGTTAWSVAPPPVPPEFHVGSSVEGTSSTLTVEITPRVETARLVDYAPTLVQPGESQSDIDIECGAALEMDVELSVQTADDALQESWLAVAQVWLPSDAMSPEPWTLSAVVSQRLEGDTSWTGSLEVFPLDAPEGVELDGQSLTLYLSDAGGLSGSVDAVFLEVVGEGVGVWSFVIGTLDATRQDSPPG